MRGRTLNSTLHHPRRGAEHHARADEDVPHPHRLRLARPSSPATSPRSTCPAGAAASPASSAILDRHRRPRRSCTSTGATSCGTASCRTSSTPTRSRPGRARRRAPVDDRRRRATRTPRPPRAPAPLISPPARRRRLLTTDGDLAGVPRRQRRRGTTSDCARGPDLDGPAGQGSAGGRPLRRELLGRVLRRRGHHGDAEASLTLDEPTSSATAERVEHLDTHRGPTDVLAFPSGRTTSTGAEPARGCPATTRPGRPPSSHRRPRATAGTLEDELAGRSCPTVAACNGWEHAGGRRSHRVTGQDELRPGRVCTADPPRARDHVDHAEPDDDRWRCRPRRRSRDSTSHHPRRSRPRVATESLTCCTTIRHRPAVILADDDHPRRRRDGGRDAGSRRNELRSLAREHAGMSQGGWRSCGMVENLERDLNPITQLKSCSTSSRRSSRPLARRRSPPGLFGLLCVVVGIILNVARAVSCIAEAAPKTWAIAPHRTCRTADRAAGRVRRQGGRLPALPWISPRLIGVTNVILPARA